MTLLYAVAAHTAASSAFLAAWATGVTGASAGQDARVLSEKSLLPQGSPAWGTLSPAAKQQAVAAFASNFNGAVIVADEGDTAKGFAFRA